MGRTLHLAGKRLRAGTKPPVSETVNEDILSWRRPKKNGYDD